MIPKKGHQAIFALVVVALLTVILLYWLKSQVPAKERCEAEGGVYLESSKKASCFFPEKIREH